MSSERAQPRFVSLQALLTGALALLLAGPLRAADGDPMGSGVVHFAGGGTDGARAVAVQPDGKVISAGTAVATGAGSYAVGLARFHPNGNLDFGFGTNGVVVDPFGFGISGTGAALHRLTDGRLLVAGSVDYGNGDRDFYVGRLLENGALLGRGARPCGETTGARPRAGFPGPGEGWVWYGRPPGRSFPQSTLSPGSGPCTCRVPDRSPPLYSWPSPRARSSPRCHPRRR